MKMLDNAKLIVAIFLSINSGCAQIGQTLSVMHVNSDYGFKSIVGTAKMSVPRSAHAATRLPDGNVLVTGGIDNAGEVLGSAEVYLTEQHKFKGTGNMIAKRVGHTASLLKDGRVLIVGGLKSAEAEIYDPVSNTFTPTDKLRVKRADHTATVLEDGRVLIAGGSRTGTAESPVADAEIFDPRTGRFSAAGSMNVARQAHTATLLKDGKVLITGGGAGRYPTTTVFKSAEIYDPATGNFTLVSNMTIPRYKHAAILLPNGKVLITGGSDQRDWRGRYASAEVYDPGKNVFLPIAAMSSARFKHRDSLVLLPNEKVFISGGSARPEVYDPKNSSFTQVSDGFGEPMFFSTATLLQSGEVLVVGGYGEGTPERGPISTASAWLYRL